MAGCMSGCSKMPRLGPLRHLIAWWFVFSMVVASIYSSSYYSHLTSPEFTPKIRGIKQLLEQKISWGSLYPKPHKWIFHPSDEDHIEYAKYYSMESSIEDRISRLEDDNYAFYCLNINNLFFMDVEDISPHTLTRLRTFRTCLGQYFVSFGLRRGTSYLEQLDNIILGLLQSGIIDYWLTNTIVLHYGFNPFNRMYEYKPQNKRNIHEPLSLGSLEGAFYLYLVGTLLSGIVFLLELRQQKKWRSSEKELLRIVQNNQKIPRRPRQQRSRRVLLVRSLE
uniref:Ionotropic glutamate receptor C-terminal domain-containing protein n=1 Tax=Cacopsylla melanoneura TaxID=428564 RepID=A0A8D8Q1U6_9HEMI